MIREVTRSLRLVFHLLTPHSDPFLVELAQALQAVALSHLLSIQVEQQQLVLPQLVALRQ